MLTLPSVRSFYPSAIAEADLLPCFVYPLFYNAVLDFEALVRWTRDVGQIGRQIKIDTEVQLAF